MKDPQTPAEWQQAVDAAAAWRAIADCKMYGLLAGGPAIDVGRCDNILAEGTRRGIHPSRPAQQLAVGLVTAWNLQADQTQPIRQRRCAKKRRASR